MRGRARVNHGCRRYFFKISIYALGASNAPKNRVAAAQIDLHRVLHPVDQKRSLLNTLDR